MLTLILACLGMAGALAIDAFLPSIPAIAQAFQVSPIAAQQTLSVYLFLFALMMLFYGTLSDSFGRRPVLMAGFALYTLSSLAASLAPSFAVLLVCRAMQGFSAGSGSVISNAIVQDRFSGPQAQKMLAQMMMVFGLAPAIAPVIGGWLQVLFGWRSTFLFMALFGAVMLATIYFALPESLPKEQRHAFHPVVIARNYWKVMVHHQFLLLVLSLGITFGGLSLYIGSAAQFVMGILHKPETAFAWMFVPMIGGMIVGSGVASKLAHRIPPAKMNWLGYAIMAVGGLINVLYTGLCTPEVPWAVLPLGIYTFGLAFSMPATNLTALELFPNNRGLASSMTSFVQMMTFALVSGLVAPLLFDSAFKLACGLMAGVVLGLICWRLSYRMQP
ncbi:multidrug effflux MFS transporter [Massilia sp. TS11]|uniref:multidrug effflux MFS transporter n=1 Tax=Massilia sp. TS11 TaxID=2908003 RepID=UPI001EDA851D|nr:multidrug effflux MFS transporter [Massilia sp. TS11]MCG2584110.1 multidrug effflux MFS transporter [Massilia sp. TS11]